MTPRFARELRDAAAARRVVPRLVSDAPEEWRLGPLTLRVDRRRGAALLRYARLPVTTNLPCDAKVILAAWERTLVRLARASMAPDDLLGALARAYRALGAGDGQRVALARLFSEVARGRPGAYARSQFAYDLARLRRERRLVHQGRRVDLGVATGGAAARKRDVVWLEDESGTGAYYLHFRMLPETKEPARAAKSPA